MRYAKKFPQLELLVRIFALLRKSALLTAARKNIVYEVLANHVLK